MVNNFNETSFNIFKIFELNSKLNQKTPLGLLSLMIQLNHGKELLSENIKTNDKNDGMEF